MKTYTDGEVIQRLRERLDRGTTQAQLARDLGFSPQFLNDVLSNRRKLTGELASALGFNEEPRRFTRKAVEKIGA